MRNTLQEEKLHDRPKGDDMHSDLNPGGADFDNRIRDVCLQDFKHEDETNQQEIGVKVRNTLREDKVQDKLEGDGADKPEKAAQALQLGVQKSWFTALDLLRATLHNLGRLVRHTFMSFFERAGTDPGEPYEKTIKDYKEKYKDPDYRLDGHILARTGVEPANPYEKSIKDYKENYKDLDSYFLDHMGIVSRALIKNGRKKPRGRRSRGRRRGPRQAGAQQRRAGRHSTDHGPLQKAWASLPPPASLAPSGVVLQARAATVQGEQDAHLLRRPPERGGGH